jgi:hypothetical protein
VESGKARHIPTASCGILNRGDEILNRSDPFAIAPIQSQSKQGFPEMRQGIPERSDRILLEAISLISRRRRVHSEQYSLICGDLNPQRGVENQIAAILI